MRRGYRKLPKSSSLDIQVGRDGEPENKPSVVVGLEDANALAVKSSLLTSAPNGECCSGRVGLGSSASASHCRRAPKSTVVATGDEHGSPRVHHARSNFIPSFG